MSLCNDISEFLEKLKTMRTVDDRIVYELNTSIPTQSFADKVDPSATCQSLFAQLVESHMSRGKCLQECIDQTTQKVKALAHERQANPDDFKIQRALKREQTKLRELQTQVDVDEVIRGRTLKIYNERCRAFYKPPQNTDGSD